MNIFNILVMVIAVAILAVPILIVVSWFKTPKTMFCGECGTEAPGKLRTKGSLLIEVVLWLCFLLPGLIYSIWRHTSRAEVCSACGSERLLPPNSPVANKLRADLAPKQAA